MKMNKSIILITALVANGSLICLSCSKKTNNEQQPSTETKESTQATDNAVSAIKTPRDEINAFLKSCENLAVSAEKAAKKKDKQTLLQLTKKYSELSAKALTYEAYSEFTIDDNSTYMNMLNRYEKAAASIK